MKTTIKIKLTSLLIAMFLFHSMQLFSQAHATMGLRNIKASSSTIEFDLYLINDGNTALKLSAASYGVNYDAAILNQGQPSFHFIQGSQDEALNGLNEYVFKSTLNENFAHLRLIMAPAAFELSPQLKPNEIYRIGRFQFSNSNKWASNSVSSFSLQELLKVGLTTTQLIAYVDNATSLTNLSVKNKTLNVKVESSSSLNPTEALGSSTSNATFNVNMLKKAYSDFKLYPNPVADKLNAEFIAEVSSDIHLKIISIDGKLQKHILAKTAIGFNAVEVDMSELANGIYTIQLLNGQQQLLMSQLITKK